MNARTWAWEPWAARVKPRKTVRVMSRYYPDKIALSILSG